MPDPTHADPAADDSVAESASSSTDSSARSSSTDSSARRAGPYDAMWDDSQLLEEEPESSVPQRLEELRHGETIADEDAEVAVTAVPSRNGIEVLAVVCDNGHPNPPQRATCYTCDAPVGGQPRQMARPQLGWLRINGGEKVPLLGPVVAGRNPPVQGDLRGDDTAPGGPSARARLQQPHRVPAGGLDGARPGPWVPQRLLPAPSRQTTDADARARRPARPRRRH